MNADNDLMAAKSAYCYGNGSVPNIVDPDGTDAIWITSIWYLGPLTIPFGHTSLLIQDAQGTWYYTMYASNGVYLRAVPDYYMDSLPHFNEYLDSISEGNGVWCDYNFATYIEGDFSEALTYFEEIRDAYRIASRGLRRKKTQNKRYNLFTNNCVTVSLDMLEMGITPEGESMKTWMEEQCRRYKLQYPASFIPICNYKPIQELFGNASFTKPEE